jgi:hypothetical protein
MKTNTTVIALFSALVLLFAGCTENKQPGSEPVKTSEQPTETTMDSAKPTVQTTAYAQPTTTAKTQVTSPAERQNIPETVRSNTIKVTEDGWTSYGGYKFKLNHLIYAAGYNIAGALIDVQKPDGSVVMSQADRNANAQVDDLEFGIDISASNGSGTGGDYAALFFKNSESDLPLIEEDESVDVGEML